MDAITVDAYAAAHRLQAEVKELRETCERLQRDNCRLSHWAEQARCFITGMYGPEAVQGTARCVIKGLEQALAGKGQL